jgi:hypothetical protein
VNIWRLAVTVITLLFPVLGHAVNPFLDAKNDQGVLARFRGTEWSDDIAGENIPLTARAVTTRIAKMLWGSIFKIEFTDLKSRAEKQREIRPDYFIVTDNRIVLLNEEDNDTAARKISAMAKAPEFEANDVYGITAVTSNIRRGNGKRQSN